MIDQNAFAELITELERQVGDRALARRYAVLIGDMPIRGEDGKLVVMDGVREVARLEWLEFFGGRN